MVFEIFRLIRYGKKESCRTNLLEVAYSDLFWQPTFRFPPTNHKLVKSYLSASFSLIKRIWSRDNHSSRITTKSMIILDSFNDRWEPENRIKYVKTLFDSPYGYSLVNKHNLVSNLQLSDRLLWTCYSALIQPLVMLIFIGKGGLHQNGAILCDVFLENHILSRLMRANYCDRVVYFNSYEFDSNFAYLKLKKFDVNCVKVPSSNPLSYHYKSIFTDTLILTSMYQMEEIEENIIYTNGEVNFWSPENAPLYLNQYLTEHSKSSKRIGFYSSANWLRFKSGRVELERRVTLDGEIISEMGRFCKKNNLQFVIFLHPREKIHTDPLEVTSYYKSLLHDIEFEFFTFNIDGISARHLDYIDLAVSPITTLFFERIFCGFKTLMVINEKNIFPHANSKLNNICFSEVSKLAEHLNQSLNQNTDSFFKENGLGSYVLNGISKDLLKKKFSNEL